MRKLMLRLWRDEAGQDLTEYALLLVLLALGAIIAMKGVAMAINTTYGNAAIRMAST